MIKVLFLLIALLIAAPAGAATYSYGFGTVEDPLSDSGNWSGGYSGFGNLRAVSGGKAQLSALDSDERMTVNSISPTNNQYAQVKVVTWNSSTAAIIAFHLLLRWTAPTTATGCEVVISRQSGQDYVGIQEIDAGTETPIGSPQTITIAANDVFKAEIVGTTLTVYQNTVQRAQETCDNVSSGRIGLGGFIGSSGALTDVELDDYEGGDVGGAPVIGGRFSTIIIQ